MAKTVGSPYDGSQQKTGYREVLVTRNVRKEVWGAGVCFQAGISVVVHTAGVCLHVGISVVVHTTGVCLHTGVSELVHTAEVCLHTGVSVLCTLLTVQFGAVIGSLCSGQPSGLLSTEFNGAPICDARKRCCAEALAMVPQQVAPSQVTSFTYSDPWSYFRV